MMETYARVLFQAVAIITLAAAILVAVALLVP